VPNALDGITTKPDACEKHRASGLFRHNPTPTPKRSAMSEAECVHMLDPSRPRDLPRRRNFCRLEHDAIAWLPARLNRWRGWASLSHGALYGSGGGGGGNQGGGGAGTLRMLNMSGVQRGTYM
jgi:hypothetical protein